MANIILPQPADERPGPQRWDPRESLRDYRRQDRMLRDKYVAKLTLERLRYKGYVRRGTLAQWSAPIRESIRNQAGLWYWLYVTALLGGYVGFSGWVIQRFR